MEIWSVTVVYYWVYITLAGQTFSCFKPSKSYEGLLLIIGPLGLRPEKDSKMPDLTILFRSEPQRSMSPDPEDGMIPDSPIMPSSLPLANKLKRSKKHCDTKMRFAGTPLPESHCMMLNGQSPTLKVPHHCAICRAQVVYQVRFISVRHRTRSGPSEGFLREPQEGTHTRPWNVWDGCVSIHT